MMATKEYGQGTAPSIPWASPPAYVKKNGGGRSRSGAGYDGRRSDAALRGQMVERIRFGTWNVGSMSGRSGEVVEVLASRKVDICCLQETRWRGGSARWFEPLGCRYKFFWRGADDGSAGVGVLIAEKWVEKIVNIVRVNERILQIKFILDKRLVHVIAAYAPQCGRSDSDKNQFWEKLTFVTSRIPRQDVLFVGGDLNGHVGQTTDGYEGVHGGNGYGSRNADGVRILEFADSLSLVVCNTFFKKDPQKLITFSSGGNKSMIDYILMRKESLGSTKDVKCFPDVECVTQHRLLVADISLRSVRTPKRKPIPRLRVWRLRDPDCSVRFHNEVRKEASNIEDAHDVHEKWSAMKQAWCGAAKKVCGVNKGTIRRKETWWWNSEVDAAVKAKRQAFRAWRKDKTNENRILYSAAKKKARYVIWKSKEVERQELKNTLNTHEGKKKVFKIAKQMCKDSQQCSYADCIKNDSGNIVSSPEDIKSVWKAYMETLMNIEHSWDGETDCEVIEGPHCLIKEDEVRNALMYMKKRKAPGPSGVCLEMFLASESLSVKWLTDLCNLVIRDLTVPNDWARSILIPVYKGKGDPLDCGSYRAIKLLDQALKVVERVLERRIRNQVTIDEMQFGFMPGRGTTDAIFIVRQLLEKHVAKRKKLFFAFIDLEKAFDRVPRQVLWWSLRQAGVEEWLVQAVKAMYAKSTAFVRTKSGDGDDFPVKVGVHQGSVLSPLLFIIVMDMVSKRVRQGLPFELLYADDLVIMASSQTELKRKLSSWKRSLSQKGLQINTSKTKVMFGGEACRFEAASNVRWPCGVCRKGVGANSILCFSCKKWIHFRCTRLKARLTSADRSYKCQRCLGHVTDPEPRPNLSVEGEPLECVGSFRYLGDVVDADGGVDSAVTARIRCGWWKFKELEAFLTSKAPSLEVKGKVYAACVRPCMTYGCETWAMRTEHEKAMERSEMRMIRWMCGVRLSERRTNEDLRTSMGLQRISDVIRRSRLRWFGHVWRRESNNWIKKVCELEVEGGRPVGRPKKTWRSTIDADIKAFHLSAEGAGDRDAWREAIMSPRPTQRRLDNGRKRDE